MIVLKLIALQTLTVAKTKKKIDNNDFLHVIILLRLFTCLER